MEDLPTPGTFKTLPDGRRLTSRPKSGGMGELEAVILPPPGQAGDSVEVWGEAHIWNGPGRCEVPGCGCGVVHKVARNKIVGQGLAHILNRMTTIASANINQVMPPTFESNAPTRSYIRVGTGSGATSDGTANLVSQNTTNPTSTLFSATSPSSGVYRHSFTAVWNSGTITGDTVTEIGVFGYLSFPLSASALNGIAFNTGGHTALSMFARLSVTDTEFSSFVINTAAPLVIEYRITLTFV